MKVEPSIKVTSEVIPQLQELPPQQTKIMKLWQARDWRQDGGWEGANTWSDQVRWGRRGEKGRAPGRTQETTLSLVPTTKSPVVNAAVSSHKSTWAVEDDGHLAPWLRQGCSLAAATEPEQSYSRSSLSHYKVSVHGDEKGM